ncbi:MAG TPA: class I SAM-dependent rRNA methyltransferase, partial [Phycisphaerae bacterium]|nr:class I SAM-dependent rRNA methyltransferase [Phycisphaerae bacterium]
MAPAEHELPYPWVRLRSATAHAFIYRRMLADVDPAARPGDFVAVYDKHDRFFGHAFYHDRSQIALRMLSHVPQPSDEEFFRSRLRLALDWRDRLLGGDAKTDVYRLVHSEGDSFSGLIAERYADVIAIEIFSLGVYRRIELIKR